MKEQILLGGGYDYILGWGAGCNEYEKQYNLSKYKLDLMIDTDMEKRGHVVCGMEISDIKVLEKLGNSRVCIVIFPNMEKTVIEVASHYLNDFDTIIARLVMHESKVPISYAQQFEDLIIWDLIDKLNIDNPYYVDLGVCHPVIINNTYMLYEHGFRKGVLIEANPDMCELIKEYRPDNVIVPQGVCGGVRGIMKYYMHHKLSRQGSNTFVYEKALQQGFADNYIDIPVENVNDILGEYCEKVPDYMDIDIEGMDEEIIEALDTNKFKIKIISFEVEESKRRSMDRLMNMKGYVHYMSIGCNAIYIYKDIWETFKLKI